MFFGTRRSISYYTFESAYFNFKIIILDGTSVINFDEYLDSGEYKYPKDCNNIEYMEECLDNSELCQWNNNSQLNFEHEFFSLDSYSVSGIQIFKYSLQILEDDEIDTRSNGLNDIILPSEFNLRQNYPNPFN